MEAGIVGLPNVGKSTLFNALTAAGVDSANFPFCTIEPNIGIVKVPDPRLERINQFIKAKQLVPAIVRIVDIAGLVRGASKGAGRGNQFLGNIRETDAIIHVVRCFESSEIIHVENSVDPIRDIETIDTELMLADLDAAENALNKSRRQAKSGDRDTVARVEILEQCEKLLADGKPLRSFSFSDPLKQRLYQQMYFLTSKPVLYVANVMEDDLHGEGPLVQQVRRHAAGEGSQMVCVCGKLEAELAELDEESRREMLADVGLKEPALNMLIRAAYKLLGLQSYFTAGEKEIRAWTVPVGTAAPKAAGVIHSDFERGFIRAEVYSLQHLEEFKTESAIRAAGKLRVEGKEYIVQDGDIIHFLVNP